MWCWLTQNSLRPTVVTLNIYQNIVEDIWKSVISQLELKSIEHIKQDSFKAGHDTFDNCHNLMKQIKKYKLSNREFTLESFMDLILCKGFQL